MSDKNIREKELQEFWEKEGIFKFDPERKGEVYSIDTPPPTMSGKMHLGHASSYTHHDIIARYHRMKGKNVFYPFGTDDNGLPTEKLVEKEKKVRIFDIERKDFTKLCFDTIKELRPNFIQDWKNIGMSCDFSLSYSTISPEAQKISQKHFIDLYEKGRAYRKETPAIWCPVCQTGIAQAEMEDKESETTFNDIIFKLEDGGEITIATTRPELLPSCVSIFVNGDDKKYTDLIGKKAIVPIFGHKVEIIADDKVDIEKGTGIVMCCTFGDTTDVEWYIDHKLPLNISIDERGKMNSNAGKYEGLKVKAARKQIIEDLKEEGSLIKETVITHDVNVHERCGTPIEILPTKQWFFKYLDLREDFIENGRKINWTPDFMRHRYENWINGLKWDWSVSRQRYFGIPLPIWYCESCGEAKMADVEDLPVDPLSNEPKGKCSCGESKFIPERDVLDTWATSSLTPIIATNSVDEKYRDKLFPMALRPQAHDIINFWLFYTVARSKMHYDKIPWDNVAISGFVLDSKGEKMSKSKGNVIAPSEVIEKFGVDALRYWATGTTFGEDIKYNEEELKVGKRTITKLSNASKFALMHLEGFDPKKSFDVKALEDSDKWILAKLNKTIKDYTNYFEKYDYFNGRKVIDRFFWNYFSSNYLELVKYRAYGDDLASKEAAQYTLYQCVLNILKLYAPIMPYVTEDVYQGYFKEFEGEKSIHLTLIPEAKEEESTEEFDSIIEIISAIRGFKSENQIAMNKEVKEVLIDSKNDLSRYFELIKKVLFVNDISVGKGDIKVNDNISLSVIKKEEKESQ
jgi:valyl-tRNA synthetase